MYPRKIPPGSRGYTYSSAKRLMTDLFGSLPLPNVYPNLITTALPYSAKSGPGTRTVTLLYSCVYDGDILCIIPFLKKNTECLISIMVINSLMVAVA